MPVGLPDNLREFDDADKTRGLIYGNALASVTKRFPIEDNDYRLELLNPHYDGPQEFGMEQQKKALMTDRQLRTPMKGTWRLTHKPTNQVVEERDDVVMNVPYLTPRNTFVYNGNEYTVISQSRLKPGVYTRRRRTGEVESQFNVKPGTGKGFHLRLEPETGLFKIAIEQSSIPLVPLLKTMGLTDKDMMQAWGAELYAANLKKNDAKAIPKLYERLSGYKYDPKMNEDQQKQFITENLGKFELDPDAVARTLGLTDTKGITPQVLLRATQKLLNVSKGQEEPDDRDSLMFSNIYSVEDLIQERIDKDAGKLARTLLYKAHRDKSLKPIQRGALDNYIFHPKEGLLLGSGLAMPLEETNPLHVLEQVNRVTKLGIGGIGSAEAVTDEARNVNNSQMGFIDPITGPECWPPNAEVMTKAGWLKWLDVREHTELACMINGSLEFHKADKLHVSDYTGPMYGAKTKFVEYLVTPTHRLWVRPYDDCPLPYRIETAEYMHNRRRMVLTGGHGPFAGSNISDFMLPECKGGNALKLLKDPIDMLLWAEFMGWFLSEGSTSISKKTKRITVSITQNAGAACDAIRELLTNLPFAYSEYVTPGTDKHDFRICRNQLGAHLRLFGDSHDKYIPEYFFTCSADVRRALLDSLLLGDGRRKGTTFTFCSASNRLALDVERLAFSLGYSTRVRFEKDTRPQSLTGGMWCVHLNICNERVILGRTARGTSQYYIQQYRGKVYCATVPGGLLYCKYGSSIGHWSGNSGAIGIDTRAAYKSFKGNDRKIYGEFRVPGTTKHVYLTPEDISSKVVAFPGEMASDSDMAVAMVNSKIEKVPKSTVELEIPSFAHMMSPAINLNPMPTAMMPGRQFYAAKYWSQFMPLKEGEVPMVDTLTPDGKETFKEYYGKKVGCVLSKQAGTVIKVKPDMLTIANDDGTTRNVELVKDFPFNRLSVTGDTPVFIRHNGNVRRILIRDYSEGTEVLSYDPMTKSSAWQTITGFTRHENTKRLFRVSFASGRHVDVTEDHSLLTLNDSLQLVPVYPLDCIVNKTRCPIVFGAAGKDTAWTYEQGILDGLYLSEGSISQSQKGLLRIAVEPKDRQQYVRELVTNLGHKPHKPQFGSVGWTSHELARRWETDFGHGAYTKCIESHVYSRGNVYLRGLISGYMGGDGYLHCDTNEAIQVCAGTISYELQQGLVAILNLLGIFATYTEARPNGLVSRYPIYKIRVRSSDLNKIEQWFCYPDRQQKFESLVSPGYRATDSDCIPVSRMARKLVYASHPGRPSHFIYKSATKGSIAKQRLVKCTGVVGAWANSDILWDTVIGVDPIEHQDTVYDFSVENSEAFALASGLLVHNTGISYFPSVEVGAKVNVGDILAHSNFTDKKTGAINMGRNLKTTIIPASGHSYEDAYVISQTAANKLATERLYGYDQDSYGGTEIGRNKFISAFPQTYNKEQIEKLDEQGVIKQGTIINKGDPIILATGPKLLTSADAQLGKLHKVLRNAVTDKSILWEHNYPGIVTDVAVTAHGARVNIKATPPVQEGDKLTTTLGSLKGVVGKVMPDDQMPRDLATNEPYELLLNPMGVLSRVAPNQVIEMALGKLAKRTGKQMRLPQQPPPGGWQAWATKQLKDAGVSETSDLFDPDTSKTIKSQGDGYVYVSAFHHLAEKKLSHRGEEGAYTIDEQPAKGGISGAKRFGTMEVNGALSHGATAVIKDAITIRGTKNEDFWKALRLGRPLPEPQIPFIYTKFLETMKAGGINIVDKGDTLSLMPMTDKEVTKFSKGTIRTSDMITSEFEPITGGLFDMGTTGGMAGARWGHIDLKEPIPNPVMEEPVRRILGLTVKKLRNVIAGTDQINGLTGGIGLQAAMKNIDIDQTIAEHLEKVKRLRGANRDNSVKVLGYLTAAKKQGIHPSDWMISKVPVIPPVFRPIARMGDMALKTDLNELYRDLIEVNKSIGDLRKDMPESALAQEKLNLYDATAAAYGLGDPITSEGQSRRVKGAISQIIGTNPKWGQFQSKVISKTVSGVGRGTAAPDPNLDMDSLGIPEDSAWVLYKDFVMRRLVRQGVPALRAIELIDKKSPEATEMLNAEMAVRPVILNRAPSWHKFNLLAFYPHIVEGHILRVSPLVNKGFGLDFDGDAMNFHVPISDKAVEQTKSKMLPSKNLFSLTDLKSIRHSPSMEMTSGLFQLTSPATKKPVVYFNTLSDAKKAYNNGTLGLTDPIVIRDGQ